MKYTFQTDDDYEAECLMNATEMRGELCGISEFIRGKLKHCEMSEETRAWLEEIRKLAYKWEY